MFFLCKNIVMNYAEVSFRQKSFGKDSFTFKIPTSLQDRLQVGQIAEVPFRNSKKKGLIIDINNKEPSFETRPVLRPLTPPLLSEKQLELAYWLSKYYFTSFSRVISLFIPQKIWNSDGLAPVKTFLKLNKEEKLRGEKQKTVINYLKNSGVSEINQVREETGASSAVLKNLLEKGIIKKVFEEKFTEQKIEIKKKHKLDENKKSAYESLKKSKKSLLFGQPGTGKSFLIRYLSAEIADSKKQALILAPEISLTFEMLRKNKEFFESKNILVFHSRLTEREKIEAYWKVKKNEVKIILGSRSALFLPFADLGLIAVEEEHDNSYKNDQSPRYRTNDFAEKIADLYGAKLVLSSATPAVETFYKAKNSEIDLIKLENKKNQPKISIIDIKGNKHSPLSHDLIKKIGENLEKKKKIILFLNRRGMHSVAFCKDCGSSQKCPYCQISLVHHKKQDQDFLFCHHCGRVFYMPEKCEFCQGTKLDFFGFGTQKIEQLIKNQFPMAKILRADRDNAIKKGNIESIFKEFFAGSADILIGTQIVTKGFDSDQIGLVGVVLADTSLQVPDFRSEEKTFQILTQVIGRTNRGNNDGEALVQTLMPNSKIIQEIVNNNYEKFYKRIIDERKKFTLPPFRRIAKLIIREDNQQKAFLKARKIEEKIKKIINKEETVCTAPPLTPFKYGKFNVNIFVYSSDPEKILAKLNTQNLIIDLDPMDITY